MAYEETRRSAYYYDSPDAVEDYGKVMNHLRHLALNPKRSRALIAKVRKENFNYVKEHGFRSFYTMTDQYLASVVTLTEQGRESFEANEGIDTFPPFWLFKLDLNSIEVPTHCDVCRVVITYAERALDTA